MFEVLNVMTPGHWCPKRAAGPEYAAGEIGGVANPPETTLPKTNSSHLKMDGWNTILTYWVSAYFQGRKTLVFREKLMAGTWKMGKKSSQITQFLGGFPMCFWEVV